MCHRSPLSCEKFEIMMSGGADVSALVVRESHSLKNRSVRSAVYAFDACSVVVETENAVSERQ